MPENVLGTIEEALDQALGTRSIFSLPMIDEVRTPAVFDGIGCFTLQVMEATLLQQFPKLDKTAFAAFRESNR